jgi:hypothetical protein
MIPDVVRYVIAGFYMFTGLVLASMVIKSYRFKLDVDMFDMFAASFVGLFCFSASILMITVV